jgi:predicted AAA+ superfamily ATPase
MHRFSSYGPVDKDLHYYALRQELVDFAYRQLVGKNLDKGGHYVTVWVPRQRGKTWMMQQVVGKVKARRDFDVAILAMQSAKHQPTNA